MRRGHVGSSRPGLTCDNDWVISLTGGWCRVVEVRGIAGMWWAGGTMWQAVADGRPRLSSAVVAISCVSWTGNQPSGLLTGEEPCRSMNG